jgi:hypothetical protein
LYEGRRGGPLWRNRGVGEWIWKRAAGHGMDAVIDGKPGAVRHGRPNQVQVEEKISSFGETGKSALEGGGNGGVERKGLAGKDSLHWKVSGRIMEEGNGKLPGKLLAGQVVAAG